MSVTMTSGSEASWLETLVPVGTFALGYLFSSLGGWRERRRARRNLETVLLYELGANHRTLARYQPLAEQGGSGMRLLGRGASLSTDVQRTYLRRMDSLPPSKLSVVLDAYAAVDSLRRSAAGAREDVKNKRIMVLPSFSRSWPRALSKSEKAIGALHGGSALLKEIANEEAQRIRDGKACKSGNEGEGGSGTA